VPVADLAAVLARPVGALLDGDRTPSHA
jgi:hypothetical protein